LGDPGLKVLFGSSAPPLTDETDPKIPPYTTTSRV